MGTIKDNLYNTIRDKNPDSDAILVTSLDSDNLGEKVLWIDGILRWESVKNSSLRQFENEILSQNASTIINTQSGRLFCEKLGSKKELVICGAGHVSIPVIEIAKKTGFNVTVIEDRPYFADNARRAGADNVICDDFIKALDNQNGGNDTYFVIVTRGHRYDMDCLKNILNKKSAYVGMMGSKRRVAIIKKELLDEGFLSEAIDKLHAPIGLSIGAQTPDEIAVSIMAELIQIKNIKRKISTYDKELLSYIAGDFAVNSDTASERGILCTIVEKKGSAPRECGTKMLVLYDNKIIGTIGGGCAENGIIEKARLMLLEEDDLKPRLETVDMTSEDDEGMVCGGTILVLMESVSTFK